VSYRIGFDVGGTFTDFVLQSPAGELTTAKRLTTYPDPSEACLAGLDALLASAGVAWRDVAQAVHGTTLGSNVVIERKARGVGLLTTRGFRDVLLIGREKRYQVYDLQIEKPRPLVPRRLIGEVTERVLADGSVRTPLDEADARRAIRALAERGGIVLSLEKMDRIVEVSRADMVCVTEPGVILENLQKAVEAEGLFYPPDPNSQAICSIGGNLAHNAGGPRALKYGVTRDYVLGVEAVLPNGELIQVGGATLDRPGLDLLGVLVGSEGTLAIVTKATLRLLRRPEAVLTMLAGFASIGNRRMQDRPVQ